MVDLSPYVGRWVAMVRDRVVGVGQSEDQARHMATQNRPKEKHRLLYVSPQVQVARAAAQHPLLQTAYDLAARHDIPVYLVGGSVRDLLLGLEIHDLDFAVQGNGLDLARRVADRLRGAFVALDQKRQTGRVILLPGSAIHAEARVRHLDFASLRGSDLLADLRDRDFTFNAMALERTPEGQFRLRDPLDGSTDLARRILRAASPTSFVSDPVRTLRAVRMMARFRCQAEPQTFTWLQEAVPDLLSVSAERIRDEWFNILQQAQASSALRQLHELGLLTLVAPPLAALQGLAQPVRAPQRHRATALTHAFETVRAVEELWAAFAENGGSLIKVPGALSKLGPHIRQRYSALVCDERSHLALLKCAALLHDVGKPETRSVDPDGRVRFLGHERAGARIAHELARRWRCSNAEANILRTAVEAHMRPTLLAREPSLSRRAVYRFYRDTGDAGLDAAFVALADYVATWGPDRPGEGWRRQAETVARLWSAHFDQHRTVVSPRPLLSGKELLKLGVPPGPGLGAILERLREEQAAGEVRTRQGALAMVKDWLAKERD